ncbi:ABC transporter, fused permease protein [hydrothermal vent metagenome]|uniref:ABC transporter, fused permease protein n=1 Tax=hydrothermal vent metagenome TaxID=652676 RepID=A0A3B0YNI7_9ZZZZ
MIRWRLSMRLLVRNWRSGEQRILVAALIIAVAASTAIGFFTDRLSRGMANQSADFLGADLTLVSPRPIDTDWLREARATGLQTLETLEFASVVVGGDALLLSSVNAVQDGFPLRGSLRTAPTPFATDAETKTLPRPGEAWVAPRLLTSLGLQVGDSVEVGAHKLHITQVITFEPGQVGDPFGLSPRLLMRLADVPATGVVQPGSRLRYQYLFAGREQDLKTFRSWLEPRLGPSHELVGVKEGRRAVGSALERAERFLGLSVLAAIVLAGVAVAMAARRYSERYFDMSAMLRCMGASQRDLLGLYLPQLLVLGLAASAIGCFLGWVAQYGLLYLLADLLPAAPSTPHAWPLLAGLATGLITLTGFALPPVMRLKDVPPLRVLRRDLLPLPSRAWLVYGAALSAIVAVMWRYTDSWPLTLSVLAGGIALVALLSLLALLLLVLSQRLNTRVGVAWRFGLNNLWRHRRNSINQILAFGLTLMAMAVVALVRTDLLTAWQRQLPADAPNHFAVNILPDQVDALRTFMQAAGIETAQLYPMVRGRLVEINGKPVREAVSKEARNDNALNRELNLTWTTELQADNSILTGRWWQPGDTGKPLVSVESKLAERLGIKPGDDLRFAIGAERFNAKVVSIRSVKWESFRPNFYMVFPPGVIDQFPATYLTSFYLHKKDKPLLRELVARYPAVTILELDRMIEQVGRIFRQVTLAVEYVLVFTLLAGFAVLFAALQASQDDRLYEGALLRALGGSRRQLRAGHLAEFTALGGLAGLLAAIGAECLAWVLYSEVLHLEYSIQWWLWIAAPVAGALLIGAAGYWGTRAVVEQSPMLLLRNQ